MKARFKQLAAMLCLSVIAGSGYAADGALDLTLPASSYYTTQTQASFMLAQNDADTGKTKSDAATETPAAAFEPKMFSGSKVHQYLGVGTAALAGLAFATHIHPVGNVPREVNGTHGELGKAAGIMALATVATGVYAHWDDFNLEDGWSDPDNLHVLLATTGALLMSYAVYQSATQTTGTVSHAGMAELGALGMVAAIKLTW
jgi:hypothetical protein